MINCEINECFQKFSNLIAINRNYVSGYVV